MIKYTFSSSVMDEDGNITPITLFLEHVVALKPAKVPNKTLVYTDDSMILAIEDKYESVVNAILSASYM